MSLLPLIRCPDCKGRLSVHVYHESRGEVQDGLLKCGTCGLGFPIVRFIPRFVSSDQYVRSFSVEWNIFSRTQLDAEQKTETRDTFIEKTGIRPEDLAGKVVLDAGCGMGRFSDVVSRHASTTVIGFDMSMAVEAAYKNIGSRPNVHIVQADIMKPPFEDETFDFIFSIGVLHHTPNPKDGFKRLVRLVRNGGEIAVWVYVKSDLFFFSDLFRKITSRMPLSMLLGLSKVLVKLYWFYKKFPYLLKFVPISMHKNPEWRLLDTFDWYSPKYQYKFSTNEVLTWFKEMQLGDIQTQAFPVSVRGRRLTAP